MTFSLRFCRLDSPPCRIGSRTPLAALVLAVGVLAPLGASALAAESALLPLLAAPVAGERIESAAGAAEVFSFTAGLASTLSAAPFERELRIRAFPIAPGERADVVVARYEVYSPDARIYLLEGSARTELPRSRWVFLWGEAEADSSTRVFLSIDPDNGEIRGFANGPRGTWDFQPYAIAGDELSVIANAAFWNADPSAAPPSWSCGQEVGPVFPPISAAAGADGTRAISTLHSMTVAIDTDNEFMSAKACTSPGVNCNNPVVATNYIANLIAAMNVMYQRDLLVRLLQGATFIRGSANPDPYLINSGTGATGAELQEFSTYWTANFGNVPRGLALMISGKSPSTSSASGIAWINGLCSNLFGYSFNKVFGPAQPISNDGKLVGHELGHNFGSDHTHCYSPPIDTCAIEPRAGCYPGPGTSCPAATTINGVTNVRGTVMSYCHGLSGCSSSSVFHPVSVALLAPIIQSKVNVCIFPGTGQGTRFFTVSPCRIIDTRSAGGGGAIGGNATRIVQATGICGVPSSAKAISVNVSVVAPGSGGSFSAFPGNEFPLGTTTINFSAGQTRTNNAVGLLATNGAGTLAVQNIGNAPAHLVVDVNGYFQ